MEDIYLKITLHDDDFLRELKETCDFLSHYLLDSKLWREIIWTYENGMSFVLNNKVNKAIRSKIVDMICVYYDINYALDLEEPEFSMKEYIDKKLDISICTKDCISYSCYHEDCFIRLNNYYTKELEWFIA